MESEKARRLLERLRQLRKIADLSQEQLAERAGLLYKHYQSIEAGRKPKVQLPTLIKIAEGLGIDLWELFHPTAGDLAVAEQQARYERSRDLKAQKKKRRSA